MFTRVFSLYSIVSLQILRVKIHESGGFAQFLSRTVFEKGLIILCTGVLPCALGCCLALAVLLVHHYYQFNHFVFSGSFVLICPGLVRRPSLLQAAEGD